MAAVDPARSLLELAAANEALARRGRELARSHRDLEVVAAAAAHDLKEPLQVIRMFASIIERTDPKSAEPARVIRGSVERMAQMLDGLMALTRIRGDQTGIATLSEVCAAVRMDLAARLLDTGGALELDGDARVAMSPPHLRSVLQNLVGNSLKYARPGVPPSVWVTVAEGARGVEVAVDDNGRGIPPDQRVSVFALYGRLPRDREDDGAGVGLALVRRILDEYEGDVRIDDGRDGGTRVTLELPGQILPPRP